MDVTDAQINSLGRPAPELAVAGCCFDEVSVRESACWLLRSTGR